MKVATIVSLCVAACLAAPVTDEYKPGYFRPTRTLNERAEVSTIPQASYIPKPEVSNIPSSPQVSNIPSSAQVSNIPSSSKSKTKVKSKPKAKVWVGKKHVDREAGPDDWLMGHEWA